jgi:hypothetical protein
MRFEILGEITDIQTIAVSVGIREIACLRSSTVGAVGASGRELLEFVWLMAGFAWPSFIGTRRMASAEWK